MALAVGAALTKVKGLPLREQGGAGLELLSRISLQYQITLLIGLSVAAAVGVSVYLGMSAVDETEETARG